jgi:O-antigen/teichoic acid export membrane protein
MKFLQKLGITEFWINVSKLSTGSVFSQIIAIILTPFITRIFDAKDIGVLNLFNQVVGILVVISVLRLDRAIILANKSDANRLINSGFILITIFTSLILILTLPFGDFWFDQFNLKYPPYFILTIPIAFFLQSIINLFKAGGNTFTLYGTMAKAILIQALLVQVLKIAFGINLGAGPAWLVLAELISAFVVAIYLLWALYSRANFNIELIKLNDLKTLLISQNKFIKFDVPASLLNFLSWSVASFLLAYFYDAKTVGYYALGFTMLRLPMNLLGKAIGDVFYKNSANEAGNLDKLRISSNGVVVHLFSFGLLPMAAVFFFGDVLFSFFFGKDWIPAGEYSQILSIWTFIWFISSPISNLYYVLNLQHKFLQFMGISLIVRALSIIVASQFLDAKGVIFAYSIASLTVYGYQLIFLLGKVNTNLKLLITNIYQGAIFAFPALIVMFVLNLLSLSTPIMMSILFPTIGISMASRWFKRPKLSFK